jgi:hypothetical protein
MKKLMDAMGSLSLTGATGSVTITGGQSAKNKAGGQFVFTQQLDFSIASGLSNGTCTSTAPFAGAIPASATKCFDTTSGRQPVVLDGDSVNVNVPGVLSGGGACTIPVTVKANAAQIKVWGV